MLPTESYGVKLSKLEEDWAKTEGPKAEHVKKSVTNCFLYYADRKLNGYKDYVCHAFLRGCHGLDFLFNLWRDERANPSKYRRYIDWALNRSPYRDAYMVKDVDWVIKHGYVTNAHVDGALFQGANICLRALNEYEGKIEFWTDLVENYKVDENLAFVLAHLFTKTGTNLTYKSWYGHSCLDGTDLNVKMAANFVTENPTYKKKSFFETGSYNGVHERWKSKGYGQDFADYFVEVLEKEGKGEEIQYKESFKNPWGNRVNVKADYVAEGIRSRRFSMSKMTKVCETVLKNLKEM